MARTPTPLLHQTSILLQVCQECWLESVYLSAALSRRLKPLKVQRAEEEHVDFKLSSLNVKNNLIESIQAVKRNTKLKNSTHHTTRIPEMLERFLNLNKMKTKRISNHMSHYFIHNRT